MPQQYKLDKVEYLKEIFDGYDDFIFTDYRGLNVEKITQLRDELRKQESRYLVVKNNFVKVVAEKNKYPELGDNLVGPTAVAFSKKDVSEIAKILVKFQKDSPLKVKGGYISGKVFTDKEVEEFSKLPGRDQLIAMLMSTMNAPVQNFVFACNDIMGRMVRVLNAVKEKKESA